MDKILWFITIVSFVSSVWKFIVGVVTSWRRKKPKEIAGYIRDCVEKDGARALKHLKEGYEKEKKLTKLRFSEKLKRLDWSTETYRYKMFKEYLNGGEDKKTKRETNQPHDRMQCYCAENPCVCQ